MLTDCINNYLFVRRAVGFKLGTRRGLFAQL